MQGASTSTIVEVLVLRGEGFVWVLDTARLCSAQKTKKKRTQHPPEAVASVLRLLAVVPTRPCTDAGYTWPLPHERVYGGVEENGGHNEDVSEKR